MRQVIGRLGRLVFWAGYIVICVAAVIHYWQAGRHFLSVFYMVVSPAAYFIYPWVSGLWWLFLVSMCGYWASTFIGRMRPILR